MPSTSGSTRTRKIDSRRTGASPQERETHRATSREREARELRRVTRRAGLAVYGFSWFILLLAWPNNWPLGAFGMLIAGSGVTILLLPKIGPALDEGFSLEVRDLIPLPMEKFKALGNRLRRLRPTYHGLPILKTTVGKSKCDSCGAKCGHLIVWQGKMKRWHVCATCSAENAAAQAGGA